MKHLILSAILAMLALTVVSAREPAHVPSRPLHKGVIKVAFVVSDMATVIDFAGPWQVFANVDVKNAQGRQISPYELYTVGPGKSPIHTEGANHPGMTITPDYDFADAPEPDIVVLGAQHGGPGLTAWLKKLHAEHKTIMSVCTGSFLLAKTGLLDGKRATTHHWFFGNFAREFPKVKLVREVRYVQSGPALFTAGGEASGIDLALHLVAMRFGHQVAQSTADFMEYQGQGWKTNRGISVSTIPVTRERWSGPFGEGRSFVLHIVKHGASPDFFVDIPSLRVTNAPTIGQSDKGRSTLTVHVPGHSIMFGFRKQDTHADHVTGVYHQDSASYPMTLERDPPGR